MSERGRGHRDNTQTNMKTIKPHTDKSTAFPCEQVSTDSQDLHRLFQRQNDELSKFYKIL